MLRSSDSIVVLNKSSKEVYSSTKIDNERKLKNIANIFITQKQSIVNLYIIINKFPSVDVLS